MPQDMLPLLLTSLLLTALTLSAAAGAAPAADTYDILKPATITKPDCPSKCGNLTVPFPFGIGVDSGCALNSDYELNCTDAFGAPQALNGNVRFLDISDARCHVDNVVARKCYDKTGALTQSNTASYNIRNT